MDEKERSSEELGTRNGKLSKEEPAPKETREDQTTTKRDWKNNGRQDSLFMLNKRQRWK